MYKTIILFLFVLLIALTSCADTEKEPRDVKKQGEKGGICYNDGTCNEGLRCVNNICEEYIDPCLGIACDNWEKCVEGICTIRSNRCERNSDCMGSEICDVNHNCVNPTSPCQNKSCSNHGVCVIENSTAKCNCNEGYEEDGLSCIPNSENICLNVTCDEWKDCNPTNGLCELKEGKCELTQDCEEGFICDITHTCFGVVSPCDNIICSNHGSCIVENDLPKCICNHGFEANDLNCEDINECELNIDNCLDNYTCENTIGSFICNEIIVDLCENITCDEWKECNSSNGKCETKENRCSNNGECLGSQICDENHNCVNPIDPCEGQSCSNLGVCAVINNTAKCFCDEGYISDGLNCIENIINLCENITCDEWKECNSSNGRCELKSGRCERTIECLVSEICNSNHTCIQQSSTCEGQSCSNHGICVIENNIAKCNCNEGFNADGLNCIDIDECELNNGTCSENAYCNNSYGGFYCQCKSGFLGDGITCIDVNECQNGIHNCSTGADCINTEGSFSCVCKEGYNGDGLVCNSVCGDNIIVSTEDCETTNMNNETCSTLGYSAGTLSCNSCTYTTNDCRITKQWGTNLQDESNSIAVDNNGNVFVTGYTEGGLDGNTHLGRKDIFLTKFDNSGNKQWTKQLGRWAFFSGTISNMGVDIGNSVAVDNSGNVFITGSTNTGIYGNQYISTCKDYGCSPDAFLMKLDNNGNIIWTKEWGFQFKHYEGISVKISNSGNIWVYVNENLSDYNYKKFDTNGNSSISISGSYSPEFSIDNLNNLLILGRTYGNYDGNTNANTSCTGTTTTNCYDITLVKYNSSGVKQWSKQWGTVLDDYGYSIATDSNKNIFIIGTKLLKYSTDGVFEWSKNVTGNKINIDELDNLYILSSSSLSKYTNNGDLLWTKSIVSSSSFALDNIGNIFITGSTLIGLDGNTNAGDLDIFLTIFEAQ